MNVPTLRLPADAALPDAATTISRDSLVDGSFMARVHAMIHQLAPDTVIHSDEEMASAQTSFLDQRPEQQSLWVFGYGSLMWNPAIHFAERRAGVLHGWSRHLNLWMIGARGTRVHPALTLGLEPGGYTEGVALRLPPGAETFELSLVWQREAFTDAYLPRWVKVETDAGIVEAVTFISNPNHPNYAGQLSEREVAEVVASASGALGTCADYVEQTLASIEALGLHDEHLNRVWRLVMQLKD